MDQERSGNPALSKGAMERVMSLESTNSATVGGTVFKTLFLVTLVIISAALSWRWASTASSNYSWVLYAAPIVAMIFAIIAIFVPKSTPITATLYAVAEGVALGVVSMLLTRSFGNIVVQAVALTGVIFFTTLFLYHARVVRVTEKFKSVVIIATVGVALYYILSIVLGLFGTQIPIVSGAGPLGIIFSLVIVFIASLNLLLDFNFVETAAASKAPKIFEWYGAFGLILTLVWLYLEILNLLSKIRSN